MSKHLFSDIRVPIEEDNLSICRDESKCIKCGACKGVCKYSLGVYGYYKLEETDDKAICIGCGQCSNVCPTKSITEKKDYMEIINILKSDKVKIFQTSPAIRVALGEEFGLESGTNVEGKIVTFLKKIGANYVFDTTFGADLTVMEEASELLERIKSKSNLPMFTSCCPSWVNFIEIFYPEYISNLSTCKSPILMQGSIIKNYFSKLKNIDKDNIVSIAITPCTSKKGEIKKEQLVRDVDYVITTRELAELIRKYEIDFTSLEDTKYDDLMGSGTGSGYIFGSSGGVMEASCRYLYKLITGNDPEGKLLDFQEVRGFSNVKEASLNINDIQLKLAVINGTGDARKILEKIKNNEVYYDFIEVMACEGGCIAGGGQPRVTFPVNSEIKLKRSLGLYKIDSNNKIRNCYQNEDIINLYKNYLENPLSNIACNLLHTSYKDRSNELRKTIKK